MGSTLLVQLLCGIVVSLFLYVLFKFVRLVWKVQRLVKVFKPFPCLPRHWFLGNVHQIESYTLFTNKMQSNFIDAGEKCYIFWLFFNNPIVVVAHPDTAREILKSSEPKVITGAYGFLIPWLGESILISKGKKWERNRHLLTPAFHFDNLRPYVKIFNKVSDIFIDKMSKAATDGTSFEVFKPAGLLTLDNLLQCAFSYDGKVQQLGSNHPYVEAVQRLGQLVLVRSLKLHHYNESIYKWSSEGKEFYKLCKFVHEFSSRIIAERRKTLNENPDILQKRHLDFLDILLTAKDGEGQGLTDEEIRNEVDTFMFAGHDTTSSLISWSIYALGQFQEYQEKVYQEVKSVLGTRKEVEWEDIPKFKYLTCFMKEVMRLYTTGPTINRCLTKTYNINGVEVPAGTQVDISIYHIHHHPDVWSDPWEFKPERFETDDFMKRDPYSYVPFSAGPRNCIGQNFASNEEKVLIARVVNRFKVLPDLEHKPEPLLEVVYRSKNGIYIKFTL
ncbi:hypothetical protein KUTeg_010379 [Tegillarca granosa]|uniref:Cytochrome P450 n=1 Tax=Tegillarca granosa TaxID=220873 RepID=A0ABQ9F8R9_TEGGR|nr:hypothetical protein KUTeg_010379 [Tegillarca granosa]